MRAFRCESGVSETIEVAVIIPEVLTLELPNAVLIPVSAEPVSYTHLTLPTKA